MPTLQILSHSEQKKFDSCPRIEKRHRAKYFALNEKLLTYINNMRSQVNQAGFLIQIAYFRASGKFFLNNKFRLSDLKYVCIVLELEYDDVRKNIEKYSHKYRCLHQKYIMEYSGWQKLAIKNTTLLKNELSNHVKNNIQPKNLFKVAIDFLINRKIELPSYYILSEIITEIYNNIEDKLIHIIGDSLTSLQAKLLDDLIWFDDKRKKDYKFSVLAKIKSLSFSTKIKDIEKSASIYSLLKYFYYEFKVVYKKLELSESATCYYSEWVEKSKLFQLKQFKNRSKAHLYILAHLKHQYFKQTDLFIDTLLKIIGNTNSSMRRTMDKRNAELMREQEKLVKELSLSTQNSSFAFRKILTILDNNKKTNHDKNKEIRIIATNQISSNTHEVETAIDPTYKALSSINNKTKVALLKRMASKLQRKLTPIICQLEFNLMGKDPLLYNEVCYYSNNDGKAEKEYIEAFLKNHRIDLSIHGSSVLLYKGLLFQGLYNAIKSGEICFNHSYKYLDISKYLIDDTKWHKFSGTILQACGLDLFCKKTKIISGLEEILIDKYNLVNTNYNNGDNKHLSFTKENRFIISTPKMNCDNDRNTLTPIFSQDGIIPIPKVLSDVNLAINFSKCFKHHSVENVKMRPTDETIFAGILSKGCNHGSNKMANISKGINKSMLNNTINWFFSLENIQQANNKVIDCINKLSLPDIYRLANSHSHTSSDGQKFDVGVESILANYSFKYFGQSQGISVYTFIDDRQVLFYDTIMSPGEREAAFVIDGIMANNVVKSHIHSTDTHGYSETVFAVMHFLGVSFAPRIKKPGAQRLYCLNSKREYRNKNYKIKPEQKINIKLIEDNWDDILRLIATIKTRTTTASTIFKRLNSYTKESQLYKALKEFGRIIKTLYMLTYVDDVILRQRIEKQLNKIELSNKFAKAVFFANGQEFKTGSFEEQKTIVACKSFIQNCIVLWNYLYLSQELIGQTKDEAKKLLKTIKDGSVISWQHINLHGEYDFISANDNTLSFSLEEIKRLTIIS